MTPQQLTILFASPATFRDGPALMTFQVTGEFARKVLIDEDLHRELVRIALASSSAAIAASLLTDGKLSRNPHPAHFRTWALSDYH